MTDLLLDIAPFVVRLRSPLPAVAAHVARFYPAYPRAGGDCFYDFDVQLLPGKGWRRWSQSRFLLDGLDPFLPLPQAQAGAFFEWGMNWAVAHRALGLLVMHAAVLERDGGALMLPGFPGAGKSTMCASLALLRGWRLFSDELALYDPQRGQLLPHPRPVSLKNASIARVAAMRGAALGPVFRGTRKGDIAHLAVPAPAVAAAREPAPLRWVVFPRFDATASRECEEISRVEAFALISEQSFNQSRLGETGFDALCAMLDGARCFQIRYGSTEAGLSLIDELTASPAAEALSA